LLWHAFCHVINKRIWWWWWCEILLSKVTFQPGINGNMAKRRSDRCRKLGWWIWWTKGCVKLGEV